MCFRCILVCFCFAINFDKIESSTFSPEERQRASYEDEFVKEPAQVKLAANQNNADYPAKFIYPPLNPRIPNPITPEFIYSDEEERGEEEKEDVGEHTFVALLDIIFTDGSKSSCTGTIIHDNMVLTAAHCFIVSSNKFVQPELTMSFVVIGSKMMFNTGYEQYLPIERVITHPRFRGWTADLALVLTFAGMTSDKPGRVIHLLSVSTSAVDQNVTVLSWGRCKDDIEEKITQNVTDEFMERAVTETTPQYTRTHHSKTHRFRQVTSMLESNEEMEYVTQNREKNISLKTRKGNSGNQRLHDYLDLQMMYKLEENEGHNRRVEDSQEKNTNLKHHFSTFGENTTYRYNNLTVESFNFVNVQTCSRLVERCMPPLYQINFKNEIICFASEDHYITAEDAGAPVVQQGKLVGVTVGGVISDGEHVAVAMRVACFCHWFAENLPKHEPDAFKCCDDCCSMPLRKEKKDHMRIGMKPLHKKMTHLR